MNVSASKSTASKMTMSCGGKMNEIVCYYNGKAD